MRQSYISRDRPSTARWLPSLRCCAPMSYSGDLLKMHSMILRHLHQQRAIFIVMVLVAMTVSGVGGWWGEASGMTAVDQDL